MKIRSKNKLGGGEDMSIGSAIIVGVTFISLAFCLVYSFKEKSK